MTTSGRGACLAQHETLLFESVLKLIIWLDVYCFVKFYLLKKDIYVVLLVHNPVIRAAWKIDLPVSS